MKLYLVRHGGALAAMEDATRPLSAKGIQDVQLIADFMRLNHLKVDQIYHSDKLRAKQTAEIIDNALNPYPASQLLPGLLPEDAVKPIAVYCNCWSGNIMIVGHLPFLGYLVSELLFDRDDQLFVEFQTASTICLERIACSQWYLSWLLSPSLLERIYG